MIRLRDLRHAACRTPLVWSLACLLVAQALFPIQLHTRFAIGGDGQVMQICTLQGVKTVQLDPVSGEEQVLAHSDDTRSPACAFSLLMAGAITGSAAVLPGWLMLATARVDPIPPKAPSAPVLRHTAIRAPPALV